MHHPPRYLPYVLPALLLAPGAQAAIYTVGPSGTHATVEAAFAATQAAPGIHEIRIATGVRNESIHLQGIASQSLRISGGWNPPGYTSQVDDPGATVLDRNGEPHPERGGIVRAFVHSRRLELANLTLRRGRSSNGGAASFSVSTGGELLLDRIHFLDNLASYEFDAYGGGLQLSLTGGETTLQHLRFIGNRSDSDMSADGAGAHIVAMGDSHVEAMDLVFEDNVVERGSTAYGGGLLLRMLQQATARIEGCRVTGNVVVPGPAGGAGAGIYATVDGEARLELRACRFHGNEGANGQMWMYASGTARATLGSLLLADSGLGGLDVYLFDSTRLDVVHVTAAGNAGVGIRIGSAGQATVNVTNSLSWGNGASGLVVPANATTGHNLIQGAAGASNPRFVNPAAGDYRLARGSPAIDAGDATPPGGVGGTDADGGQRRVGAAPDIGAFEWGAFTVFASGFEDDDGLPD